MSKLDLFLIDDQALHDRIVGFLERELNETLYAGDERKIFSEILTKWHVQFLEELNEYFNQRFAQYATGEILDAHGENENCYRLEKQKSTATERFIIGSPLGFNVVIPKGTRVTGDNEKYFATDNVAVIYSGDTYVDTQVSAEYGGSSYNGYSIGQLNKLVDKIEYISEVKNLTETANGDDGEPYPEEDGGVGDEHYYQRIREAKAAKSTAGAEATYKYYAKSADPSISDVQPLTPEPGKVLLVVSCADGAVPSQEILDKVLAICNSKEVRPLNDKVSAIGVSQKTYDIEFTYYIAEGEENATIEEVEGEGGAIDRFNAWQSAEIGKAINPDRLRSEVLKSDTKPVGAERIEITAPVYTELQDGQMAKWSGNMIVVHRTA